MARVLIWVGDAALYVGLVSCYFMRPPDYWDYLKLFLNGLLKLVWQNLLAMFWLPC